MKVKITTLSLACLAIIALGACSHDKESKNSSIKEPASSKQAEALQGKVVQNLIGADAVFGQFVLV